MMKKLLVALVAGSLVVNPVAAQSTAAPKPPRCEADVMSVLLGIAAVSFMLSFIIGTASRYQELQEAKQNVPGSSATDFERKCSWVPKKK